MSFPGTYVLRRLLIALPSLLGISVVLFAVLALAPGDPFGELVSNPNIPAEVAANLRLKFGMDDPLAIRYLRWLAAMLQGDWGFSFASRINVDDLILQRLPTTMLVIGSSQVLAILIALPVGIYAATRPYSLFDQVASTLTFIGFSLPTFFTGLLLILVFGISARLAAVRVPVRHRRDRLAVLLGALPAGDHAGGRSRAVPGGVVDTLRALRRTRRDQARLRHHARAPRD